MSIKKIEKFLTTEGTEYSTLEAAEEAEVYEQAIQPIENHIDWRDEEFNYQGFLDFVKSDPKAVSFMANLNKVYAANPSNGFAPAPTRTQEES